MTAATSTARQQVLEALAAVTAATPSEIAALTGIDVGLVQQLLVEAAAISLVRRAGMTRTSDGLEVIWAIGNRINCPAPS